MAYTTFTEAWNDWKGDYSTYLSAINTLETLETALGNSTTWQETRDNARNCIDQLKLIMSFHCRRDPAGYMSNAHLAAVYFASKEPAGGAVTMAAILSAMLGAKFTELQDFIGIEDAYRVALWNAPFNANFYAALARGFQKWP